MKKSTLLPICFTFLLFLLFSVEKSEARQSKNVSVKNFQSISVSSGIDLYLQPAGTESLQIKGSEEMVNQVVVEQEGTHLRIYIRSGMKWTNLFRNETLRVYVQFKKLNTLTASGGSDVFSEGLIKTDQFNIRTSGGADVDLQLQCRDLSISSSGGSDVKVRGTATNLEINSSGGSDVNAFELKADFAKISASGGADIDVFVNEAIEASASGGGDIRFKGNASLRKTNQSKSGSVRHVK